MQMMNRVIWENGMFVPRAASRKISSGPPVIRDCAQAGIRKMNVNMWT